MIFAIDVGNSTTKIGLFDGDTLKKVWMVETLKLKNFKLDASLKTLPAIVSSVVPSADKILKKKFRKCIFVNAKNVKGLKIKIRNKKEAGADRIVNAFAAKKLYGTPAIVIDFGTATTFDVISEDSEYLGGAIAPGILLSRDVLHEKTAKLPLIEIKAPKSVIGNSTVEAMRSGLLYGYVAMVEGMIERIKIQMTKSKLQINHKSQNPKSKIKVIATGGLAKLIAKYTKRIDIVDTELTLKGLNLIHKPL